MRVKENLKAEFVKLVKADEQSSKDKWEKTKKGLMEKPEREKVSKIVIENDRVYAKGRAEKKGSRKPKAKKPFIETNTNIVENQWHKSVKHRQQAPLVYYQQPQQFYQPQMFTHQQQQQVPVTNTVPFINFDQRRPPPPLPHVPVSQPESGPFHWGRPTNRWKHLSPNQAI